MTHIIGITGGIGSGKSLVAHIMGIMGIPVYIADIESKRLLNSDETLKKQLLQLFGSDIFDNQKHIIPSKLASIIFASKEQLALANAIIHPCVKKDFLRWIEEQKRCGKKTVAIETAILFEAEFNDITTKNIMVYAPQEIRIKRVIDRDGVVAEQVIQRMNAQMSDDEKIKLADAIIRNYEEYSLIEQIQKCIYT